MRQSAGALLGPERDAPWSVQVAAEGGDPFEAATLWLLDGDAEAVIPGPAARAMASVHAIALLELPELTPASPGRQGRVAGLRVVLAMPTPLQLEALKRRHFHPTTRWCLIPSESGTAEREYQDAWVWAVTRPAPQVAASDHADLTRLVSDAELWALSLRSGKGRRRVAELRDEGRLSPLPQLGVSS